MKTALRRLVGLLAIACFVWVLRPLVGELGALSQRVSLLWLTTGVTLCGLLYAISQLLLVEPWRRLVGIFGKKIHFRDALWCFGRSQWAKYLPSNVMHLVGRQLLGRQLGLSQAALAVSSLLENTSQLSAALLMALVFGRDAPWGQQLSIPWEGLLVALLAALLLWPLASNLLLRSRLPLPGWLVDTISTPTQPTQPVLSLRRNLRAMAAALPAHSLFFIASASLVALIHLIAWRPGGTGAAPPGELWLALLWVVPTSWAAGTLALGAPAGIGVREAIFLLGLQPMLGATDAAGLALAFRCTTVLGDALVAAAAWRIRKEPTRRNRT